MTSFGSLRGNIDWQRRQRTLTDAFRQTSQGGLSHGFAAVPSEKETVSLTETERPDTAEGPRLVGSRVDLETSASKMGLLTENKLSSTAQYNRRALIKAIWQKQPSTAVTTGPEGSATAKDMPNGFMMPKGAKGLFNVPDTVNGIPNLKSPKMALSAPIHIGPYRMTADGRFKPLRSKLFGLAGSTGLGAPIDLKQQALAEAQIDDEEDLRQLSTLAEARRREVSLTPANASLATPLVFTTEPTTLVPSIAAQPTLQNIAVNTLIPTIPPPEIEPVEPIEFIEPTGREGGGGE